MAEGRDTGGCIIYQNDKKAIWVRKLCEVVGILDL